MKISLIIPVYNESRTIEQCLANLEPFSEKLEILFADGGSTDDTVEKIGGHYPVLRCPKGRALQMNAAAKEASGDILWFSHCDSILPSDGDVQIAGAAERGARFGCFHICFDDDSFLMRCNALNSNLRVRLRHIAFGDQGIFVAREVFDALGGFPELPIMEDYEFSRMMKLQGVPLTLLPGKIVTSGRRYRTNGSLRTMLRMFDLRCRYRAGTDICDIARCYSDIR